MRQASQETDLSRADQMLQTSHISLSRVAANGAAPPGAEASAVTSAFRRAPRGPRRADFARWGGSDGAVRGQAPPRLNADGSFHTPFSPSSARWAALKRCATVRSRADLGRREKVGTTFAGGARGSGERGCYNK